MHKTNIQVKFLETLKKLKIECIVVTPNIKMFIGIKLNIIVYY